jgi:Nif-specific regulatory protein
LGSSQIFIVREPSKPERPLRVEGEKLRVGRAQGNDLVLEDPRVSRHHALLERDGGVYNFENLTQGNPIFLNGTRRVSGQIGPGDVLQLGDTHVSLAESGTESVAPVAMSTARPAERAPLTDTVIVPGIERARLELLAEIVKVLPREEDRESFLDRVLAAIFRIMDVRRAVLAMRLDAGSPVEIVASRNREEGGGEVVVSRTIISKAMASGEGLLTSNAMADSALAGVDSVVDLQIKSAICVPILRGEEPIGVLYGDNRARARSFTREDLQFMSLIARILSMLLENMELCNGLRQENTLLRRIIGSEHSIVGTSPAIQQLTRDARRASGTDATILITGETGTGKNLLARAIHEMSNRAGRPYVEVACAAIPETLLEAELFGYGSRSGISGADPAGREGRFDLAGEGTLLLDEIGDMSFPLQAKILQALEAREFRRLGSNEVRKVRCRIIAATNLDLAQAVDRSEFRKDLYYRLRVVPFHIPPLRERPEDVLPIADYLLRKMAPDLEVTLSAAAREVLLSHSWPGNVRELRNALEQALALGAGQTIEPEHMLGFLEQPDGPPPKISPLREMEKNHIVQTLRLYRGNKKRAAEALGISRSTLYEKIRAFSLE